MAVVPQRDALPSREPRTYVVCYPPARVDLAEQLHAACPHRFLRNPLGEAYFEPERRNPNFVVPRLHDLANHNVLYLADWSTPAARYVDLCFLAPLAELAATLTVLLPFFPSGTMERETAQGVVATANVDSRLLSTLPRRGSMQVMTVDLHTKQNQFYFYNCTKSLHSCMPYARSMLVDASTTVCFPDDGAHKRFATFFGGVPVAICSKVRGAGDARTVSLSQGSVRGRKVLIVDDLVRTGGTLLECARLLKSEGAEAVDVFVPHADFASLQHIERLLTSTTQQEPTLRCFHTTDSITRWSSWLRASACVVVHPLGDILVHEL